MPDRFAKVDKNLYRGGRPSREDLYLLKDKYGINKIVSLDQEIGEDIDPICEELGLEHIIWGIGDGNDPKIELLEEKIIPNLTFDGPTYIHCKHGKDRTGMSVAMYRILKNKWPLKKALQEAFKFGMGKGLDEETSRSYYNAVGKFANRDKNNNKDVVSISRDESGYGTGNFPIMDDSTKNTITYINMAPGDIGDFSPLTRIAAGRIYCKSDSYGRKLLNPNVIWYDSADKARNSNVIGTNLFSAEISTNSSVKEINKRLSSNEIQNILMNINHAEEYDIYKFIDGSYFVTNPNALQGISEENIEDSNDIVEVGMRDNSTGDYAYSFPGSSAGMGGMPDGAAGTVVLPFSAGFGNT